MEHPNFIQVGWKSTYTYFSFWVSSLKMWTVSVLLEADRYKPSMLNANEQMLTHLKQKESLQVSTITFHDLIKRNKLTSLSRSVLN